MNPAGGNVGGFLFGLASLRAERVLGFVRPRFPVDGSALQGEPTAPPKPTAATGGRSPLSKGRA